MGNIEPRLVSRDVDEFLGIARRLAEQPSLAGADVDFLNRWLVQNQHALNYPMARAVRNLFIPVNMGTLSTRSGRDLLHDRLRALAGMDGPNRPERPTSSVFTNPVPKLEFAGKRYCFSGTFAFGTREQCKASVIARGAKCGGIARKTDYLIVGSNLTDCWKHSSFGNKISQATAWNTSGLADIKIMREVDWHEQMRGSTRLPPPAPPPTSPTSGFPPNPPYPTRFPTSPGGGCTAATPGDQPLSPSNPSDPPQPFAPDLANCPDPDMGDTVQCSNEENEAPGSDGTKATTNAPRIVEFTIDLRYAATAAFLVLAFAIGWVAAV